MNESSATRHALLNPVIEVRGRTYQYKHVSSASVLMPGQGRR